MVLKHLSRLKSNYVSQVRPNNLSEKPIIQNEKKKTKTKNYSA